MIKKYVEQADILDIDRPKRQKEVDVRYIRQVLDEIINGLDMSDADVRKLVMNELSNLQLKRKAEKMYAESVARKTGKRSKKKEKRK